jgi:HSP20 family protein
MTKQDHRYLKEVMTMLMQTDPFRELDRLTQQVFGRTGTLSRSAVMPMDAYRSGDEFVVHLDLPGVDSSAIELHVEHNLLTVKVERQPTAEHAEAVVAAERPHGVFSRQLFLSETLDAEHITASYDAGVLTLKIPVAAETTPCKIEIKAGGAEQQTS